MSDNDGFTLFIWFTLGMCALGLVLLGALFVLDALGLVDAGAPVHGSWSS